MLLSKYNKYLIVLIFQLIISNIESTYLETSNNEIRNISENVEFVCTIKNYTQDQSIIWLKSENSLILAFGSVLTLKGDESRYGVRLANNDTSIFQINDIQSSDAGDYQCQIILGMGKRLSKTVNLLVNTAPKITNITVSVSPVGEGKSTQLLCDASGYPKPTISWIREYNKMLPNGDHSYSGSKITINNAKKEDRGIYYCFADNKIGSPDKKHINLDVYFTPIITVPRPKIAQSIDYDIDLICEISAYPAPAINWYNSRGRVILSEDSYRISNMAKKGDVTTTTLRISSLENQHFGDYFCGALNPMGETKSRLNLFEQSVPNINYSGILTSSGVTFGTILKAQILIFTIFMIM